MSDVMDNLALAIHEADLGQRCKARGSKKALHVAAYRKTAERFVEHLSSRWQPPNPPEDVSA